MTQSLRGGRFPPLYPNIIYLLIIFSAVKQLIAINRIQNKSFCLHKIVYCVYLLCILYKYTHIQCISIYIYMHIHLYIYIIYKYI